MERPKRTAARQLTYQAECIEKLKKEKKREQNKRYRQRIRDDLLLYQAACARDQERARQYRRLLSEEQKAYQREKSRLRMVTYRARAMRKKEQDKVRQTMAVRPAPQTRASSKQLEERKEKNRLAQQRRRANMLSQKKRREKEKRAEYLRHRHGVLNDDSTISTRTDDVHDHIHSPSASRSATCRLKKKLGSKFVLALKGLVHSIHKKTPQKLSHHGIIYESQGKRKQVIFLMF